MADRQTLIERVQKLLDRAARDTGPESDLAQAEAERLIAKHAITATELRQEGRHVRAALEDPCLSGHAALCAGPWDDLRSPFAAMLVTTFFTSHVVCFGADNCAYALGPRLCVVYDRDRYQWIMERFQALWTAHLDKWTNRMVDAVSDYYVVNRMLAFAPPVAHPGPPPVEVDFYLGLFRGFRRTLAWWRVRELQAAADLHLATYGPCHALIHTPSSPGPVGPQPSKEGGEAPPPLAQHRTLQITPKNPHSIRAGEGVGAEAAQTLVSWSSPTPFYLRRLRAPSW